MRFSASTLLFLVPLLAPAQNGAIKFASKQLTPTGVSGSEMFKVYCAACHGSDGKGAGPAASALKHQVPDLTRIAQRNAGNFDRGKVAMGLGLMPESGAHGGTEMAVWGDLFRANRKNEMEVKLRVSNLTEYLASIQDPPLPKKAEQEPQKFAKLTTPRVNSGSGMYYVYCSSCHGTRGLGDGPAAKSLKVPPTDLTKLSQSNGGKFPFAKVQTTLGEMRGSEAHGSKEMPVWGDLLRSTERDEAVHLRITNITNYVKSMQVK